jgi:hypothetical protein
MPNLKNILLQGVAGWKRFTSYFKREWTIEDYPIRFRAQLRGGENYPSPRFKLPPWVASVINWPSMSGDGETKQEALQALTRRLNASKKPLPRPGTRVPIQVSRTDRIDKHSALAKDFVKRVLELPWAWISNDSTLWDFHVNESNSALYAKIRDTYGVDVSDISSGNLADILDRISQQNATTLDGVQEGPSFVN